MKDQDIIRIVIDGVLSYAARIVFCPGRGRGDIFRQERT